MNREEHWENIGRNIGNKISSTSVKFILIEIMRETGRTMKEHKK